MVVSWKIIREMTYPCFKTRCVCLYLVIREAVGVTETVTFWSTFRPGGLFYGEGQGVLMTKDGSREIATITPQGIGRFTNQGQKVSISGSVFFRTSSTGKLAFLNNVVGVFEYEADEAGNTIVKVWEWK